MTDLGWSIDLTQQAAGNQPAAIENRLIGNSVLRVYRKEAPRAYRDGNR
jgi:hypothetical protein